MTKFKQYLSDAGNKLLNNLKNKARFIKELKNYKKKTVAGNFPKIKETTDQGYTKFI